MKIKNIEIPEVYFYILLLSIGLLIARHVVFNSLLLNLLVTAGLALLMEVAFRIRQRALSYVEMLPDSINNLDLRIKRNPKGDWKVRYLKREPWTESRGIRYKTVFNQSGKTLEHAAKLTLKQIAELYDEKQTNHFNLTGMDR